MPLTVSRVRPQNPGQNDSNSSVQHHLLISESAWMSLIDFINVFTQILCE